jgi:hypothetical protein
MRTTRRSKPITEMTKAELAAATREFDKEFIADTFSALPAAAKARWLRAKRKVGRPRKGQGVRVISVSVERALLARSDRLARRLGISRAALVARGLEAALASVGQR